jgi:putative hemolysin
MSRKRSSETELAVSSTASALPRRKSAPAARSRKKPMVVPVEAVAEPVAAPIPAGETVETTTASSEPSYETVAALAYSYWVARGYQAGSPEEDWLRAEQELRQRDTVTA